MNSDHGNFFAVRLEYEIRTGLVCTEQTAQWLNKPKNGKLGAWETLKVLKHELCRGAQLQHVSYFCCTLGSLFMEQSCLTLLPPAASLWSCYRFLLMISRHQPNPDSCLSTGLSTQKLRIKIYKQPTKKKKATPTITSRGSISSSIAMSKIQFWSETLRQNYRLS